MSNYFPTTFGNSDYNSGAVASTSFTGDLTTGSNVITNVSSTAGITVGMTINGPFGLTNYASAQVLVVGNGSITVSETANFSFNGTFAYGTSYIFADSAVNIAAGMGLTGTSIDTGTTISTLAGNLITTSAPIQQTVPNTFTFTGTTTASSTTITGISGIGTTLLLNSYQYISGTGIPTGAFISTIGSTSITISAAATASGTITITGVKNTFGGMLTSGTNTITEVRGIGTSVTCGIGDLVIGAGIPAGTRVTAFDPGGGTAGIITMSANATATGVITVSSYSMITETIAVTGSVPGITFEFFNEQDALLAYTTPSKIPSSAGNGNLGPYAVSLTSASHGSRQFAIDTSFEPYRREAFRHRTIPAQRQSIMMTNIAGQGTVNTEGLWRREQTEWSMGAGQQYLDRKSDSQETRFYQSKGVDVFSFPLQATLLPDTYRKDGISSVNNNLMMSRCGDYVVYVNGTTVSYVTATRTWSGATTCTFDTTTYQANTPTTITAPSNIYSMDTNDLYVFLATDTGIWFCQIGTSSSFELYASPDITNDSTGNFTGGYDFIRWCNNQIITSRKNRLYAIQPRDATTFPAFGAIPSIADVSETIASITVSGTTATVTTTVPHQLAQGQPISITGSTTNAVISSSTSVTSSNGVATVTTTGNHGLSVGQTIAISGNAHASFNGTDLSVASVTSNTVFTYNCAESGPVTSGATGGNIAGTGSYGFNSNWSVLAVTSPTVFTMTVPTSYAPSGSGGSVVSSEVPDMLYTHQNPHWIWSDATGGETQVYIAGYVESGTGKKYSGCIYRSDLAGASTSTAAGFTTITSNNLVQPFTLNVPVQALPMSPDEYPVCIESYLNYIFIGTNRGIRMAQTLSIYDPTATATGDLKSGPLIPNILQPVTSPVTAIVGDGRYIWFAWNNYDDQSTGLGKLDLSNFIAGDSLTPSYASDIMVNQVPGKSNVINSLDWDPYDNVPLMAVGGSGIYAPCATNEGGNSVVFKYVPTGNIVSGIFDYGIPDAKVPVFFDYGAIAPASKGTSIQAFIDIDPNDEDAAGYQTLPSYPQNGNTAISEFPVPNYHAEQFGVNLVLYSDAPNHGYTPTLHRWTLKSWPAAVAGTLIMAVFQLFSVSVVDGMEVFVDPYDNFIWLENRRQNQEILTYQEGPLSVTCVIEALDWLPHKRRDNYENGFEGDCVVTLKTISPYSYTPVAQLL